MAVLHRSVSHENAVTFVEHIYPSSSPVRVTTLDASATLSVAGHGLTPPYSAFRAVLYAGFDGQVDGQRNYSEEGSGGGSGSGGSGSGYFALSGPPVAWSSDELTFDVNPKPSTSNPKLQTLNPKPTTQNPKP